MIEAFLGILIATLASVSVLVSIGIGNNSFKNAGKDPLSSKEKQIIKNAGYKKGDIEVVEIDIKNIVFK